MSALNNGNKWKAVIITGASRGYGRAVAVAAAKATPHLNVHLVLTARNESALRETSSIVSQAKDASSIVDVSIVPADLANTGQLQSIAEQLFGTDVFPPDRTYEELVLINNAGSIGAVAPIGSAAFKAQEISQFLDLNITSCMVLTSEFVRRLRNPTYQSTATQAKVVNITSLAAIQVLQSCGQYCATKAARDMFFKALAEEVGSSPIAGRTLSVLSYAPGPMETDMVAAIVDSDEVNGALKDMFHSLFAQGTMVPTDRSADKLMRILGERTFAGEHVDFYDV